MGAFEDVALKEVPSITEYFTKISVEFLKETNFGSLVISGEGLLYYDPDPEKKDAFGERMTLTKDIEISGSSVSVLAPFILKTTGYNLLNASDDRNTTGKDQLSLFVEFDGAMLEGYEGPLYAKVVGPGPASECVQVGIVVTEEKRIAHLAEQAHLEFLNDFKIVFAAMDKDQDGCVSREDFEKLIEGPEITREQIEESLASLTREQIEQYYPQFSDAEKIEKFLEKQKDRGAEARRGYIAAMADPEQAGQAIYEIFRSAGCYLKGYKMLGARDLEKISALLALEGDAKLSLDDLGCTS